MCKNNVNPSHSFLGVWLPCAQLLSGPLVKIRTYKQLFREDEMNTTTKTKENCRLLKILFFFKYFSELDQ